MSKHFLPRSAIAALAVAAITAPALTAQAADDLARALNSLAGSGIVENRAAGRSSANAGMLRSCQGR